jgi:acyl-coenzyme A synthetase/AMP-(fatty) acid ligase
MGADGSLHFVDRVKNLIRRSGENISALEVEQELVHHPAVAEVAVTGVADELRGEEVFAFVVLAPGQGDDAQTAASLVDWTLSRLAYHKAPGWVRFLPRLPTTPTQKLERGALKALAAQALAQSLCHDTRSRKRRSAAA